jgi:hypothetical protein
MDTRLVVGLVAGVLLLGVVYYESTLDEADRAAIAASAEGPEARSWLRGSSSESALASNRFVETRDALIFVQDLYRAGAERVVVPKDTIQSDGDESYADALVVKLPDDPVKRDRVWKLCARELERLGENPPATPDSELVFLWWD